MNKKPIILPYNFPLNTRKGFKVIYYLMRLTQSDMIKVITAKCSNTAYGAKPSRTSNINN